MALRIYLSQNETNEHVGTVGNYYARVDNNPPIDIDELAELIKEHNIGFSKGSIVGILKDMVTIIRRQVLNGQPVKIDNLAIFKASVENRGGWPTLKDVNLHIGGENDNIRDIHLLAQATGDFTRSELSKEVKLVLDRQSQQMVSAAGGNPDGSGTTTTTDTGEGTQQSGGTQQNQNNNNGGGTQTGGGTNTNTGGGTQQSGGGSTQQQGQPGTYRLVTYKYGDGTATVTDQNGQTLGNDAQVASGTTINLSVVSVDNKRPCIRLDGVIKYIVTENNGTWTGSFQMPTKGTVLEILTDPDDDDFADEN